MRSLGSEWAPKSVSVAKSAAVNWNNPRAGVGQAGTASASNNKSALRPSAWGQARLKILAGHNLDGDVLHSLETSRECGLDIKHESISKSILILGMIHTHIIDDATPKTLDSRLELQESMGLGDVMPGER